VAIFHSNDESRCYAKSALFNRAVCKHVGGITSKKTGA